MDTFSMRIVVLGIVSCLAISSATSIHNGKNPRSSNLMLDFNWPEPDPSITRFPHEKSCHHYYLMLSEHDISLEKCPHEEMFDFFTHRCTAEETAQCWRRHLEKITRGHSFLKARGHFKCPYPYGKFPHTRDCTKYHLCLHNKSKLRKCAPFEFFDKVARKCVAKIDATCADETDVIDPDFKCPKDWGSFAFSKDCSKYYECFEKKPTLRTCDQHRLFDENRMKCAPKSNTHCGSRYNPYEIIEKEILTQKPIESSSPVVIQNDVTPDDIEKDSSDGTLDVVNLSKFQLESTSTHPDVSEEPSKNILSETTSLKTASSDSEIISASTLENKESSSDAPRVSSKPTGTNSDDLSSSTDVALAHSEDTHEIKSVDGSSSEFIEVSTIVEGQKVTPTNIPSASETITSYEGHLTSASVEETTLDAEHICQPEDNTCVVDKDGSVLRVRCLTTDGRLPHPRDETRFLQCVGFVPRIESCPTHLLFDAKTETCIWQFIL